MSSVKVNRVCILLGSNIHPEENLVHAVSLLRRHFHLLQISQTWESPAVGHKGPDFLNAAILVNTSMRLKVLKRRVLLPIETKLGRVRTLDKYAPRTIDLDIAVWGRRTLESNVWRHAFAAVPVAELLPEITCGAGSETLAATAHRLQARTPIRLREDITKAIRRQKELTGTGLNLDVFRLNPAAEYEF